MGLETFGFIDDLVATNPVSGDPKSQGDDHIRGIKATLQAQFPNVSDAVTPTHTELNYVDGVTSNIQTQLDLKAPLDSPALTGAPTSTTPADGDSSTKIATTAFVAAAALSSTLPGQTGKDFYLLSTDGVTADWYNTVDTSVVTPVAGTAFATTTGAQTLTDKTATDLILADDADPTKRANFILSGVTAGQNRNITVRDNNIILDTPGWVYLSTVTASNSATVDLETTIDSTYYKYVVIINQLTANTGAVTLNCRLKTAGAYRTGASDYRYTYNTLSSANTVTSSFTGSSSIPMCAFVHNTSESLTSGMDGMLMLHAPSATDNYKKVSWNLLGTSDNLTNDPLLRVDGYGDLRAVQTAVTGIRLYVSSGNIATGTFTLFGIRRS